MTHDTHKLPGALGALCIGLCVAGATIPEAGEAFRNVAVGEKLDNVTLPTLDGKKAPLLRKDRTVNVFIFFRPDQDHSKETLKEMARCEQELAGKSVYWVAIVSDFYKAEDSRAVVKESGIEAPVLVDVGDALYGAIGVKLHPSIGLADDKFKLLAYEPYRQINYCHVTKARIQHALGEISDAELDKVLNPPKATQGGDEAVAMRNFKFGKMLLKAGAHDKALDKVKKGLELAPDSAEGHALMGAILAAQGDCAKAKPELEKALAADKDNATAKEALKSCP